MKSIVRVLQQQHEFHWRHEIDKIIGITMLFNIFLVVFRIGWSQNWTFFFMPWNLFLAYLPYCLSKWMLQNTARIQSRWIFSLLFLVWILLVPNTFYMITDLFHLMPRESVPLWYDLVLLTSFAWSGMILGILSVRQMEKVAVRFLGAARELYFIYPIMWLNALGVYIGRYLRYNSWDVLTNPFALIKDIVSMIFHPLQYKEAWGMTIFFSVLMTLMYLCIKRISKVIH